MPMMPLPYFSGMAGDRRVIRFGLDPAADVSARFSGNSVESSFTLVAGSDEIRIDLPLQGRHNVLNALAAASLALGRSKYP